MRKKPRQPKNPVPCQDVPVQLPEIGFVRLSTILQIIPVGKTTWWQGVKEGRYPQPTRALGSRITAWSVSSIRALIQEATQK